MKQILNRFVALLISMSDLAKLSGQKRVNDRSEKDDGRNSIERLPLNSFREFFRKAAKMEGGKDSSKMHTDGRINLEPGGQDSHNCSLMASGVDWDDRFTAKAVFHGSVR